MAGAEGERLAAYGDGCGRSAGDIRDCGVTWGDGSIKLGQSRRLRMDGEGVIMGAELPLRTGVEAVDVASASATVDGRVGRTDFDTSGHAAASHSL